MKHKHGLKRLARLQDRQKAWDAARNAQNQPYPKGYKRPGSFNQKKSWPAGRGKTFR